jgi:hypothetical protein
MKLRMVISFALLAGAFSAFGGAKDDFQAAVKAQCGGKDVPATGGRQGNVMKWKTCTSDSVTIDGCTLSCTDASSKIGG